MKNTVPFIITVFVLFTLYACGKYIPRDDIVTAEVSEQSAEQTTTESTDMTETAVVSTTAEPETSADIPETTAQESVRVVSDPESEWLMNEPPLSEAELAESVPDFLDEDQQLLYRRAKNVYEHLFGPATIAVEYYETLDYPLSEYTYEENERGWRYLVSQGRYRDWDDFMRLVLSVFTEDLFLERNNGIYIERDGKLTFLDAAAGGSQYYNPNFQDEFELLSKSDDEIVFDVIGHYSQIHPYANESYEERDRRVAEGWEFTDRFTIRMVNTESGWRFDEFYNPGIDERTSYYFNARSVVIEG